MTAEPRRQQPDYGPSTIGTASHWLKVGPKLLAAAKAALAVVEREASKTYDDTAYDLAEWLETDGVSVRAAIAESEGKT